jgi:hypothetical protein
MSSGEGLIWTMRDSSCADDGEDDTAVAPHDDDRRLLVVEPEFARVLRVLERDGNTLSAIIRQAWDSGTLRVMTKKTPVRASNVHVSIIGHITRDEFRRYFRTTEAANGFANRFLLACAKRARSLPFGGSLQPGALLPLTKRLDDVLMFAETLDDASAEASLAPDARRLWADVYETLSEGRPGMVGAVTARAEAQALRLAAVYAVLDKTLNIHREHLEAALAVVGYAEASARYVFDEATGDGLADEILAALRCRPPGMTRTELRDFFDRNKSGEDIVRALEMLRSQGLASAVSEKTGGRPTERWIARSTTETTLTTKAPAATPSVAPVVSVVSGGPAAASAVPSVGSPAARRVPYSELSPFQRELFEASGELHDIEVTHAPVAPAPGNARTRGATPPKLREHLTAASLQSALARRMRENAKGEAQ